MFAALVHGGRRALATASVLSVLVMTGAISASATPTPVPGGAEITAAFGDVQSLWLTVIVPAVVALMLAVLAIVVGIKWIRKTAKSA